MNAFQTVVTVATAIIGVLTGVATLYAKYLDIRKTSRELDPPKAPPPEAVHPEPVAPVDTRHFEPAPRPMPEAPRPEPVAPVGAPRFERRPEPAPRYAPTYSDRATIDRARKAVKAPAIALIVGAAVYLFSTVVGSAVYLYDQFVTPITDDTKRERAFEEAIRSGAVALPPGMQRPPDGASDRAGALVTMVILAMGLSLPSLVALWAGIGMLRLRGYWVSVVGSYCIMGGSLSCCFTGIPIGIWSLTVLMRPEVKAAFR